MENLFTIGEMAKLFGMNIRTLRYYDQIQILVPEWTDPKTGYRYYSTKQFERLNTIKYLRALNIPLEKIKSFFENKEISMLSGLLKEQQLETRKKMEELKRIDQKIGNHLKLLQDSVNTIYDKIQEVYIPQRKVAFLRKEIPVSADLEYSIRELEQMHHLESLMFLGKVGVSISEGDLKRKMFGHFSGIFVFVEEEDRFNGKVSYLRGSDYVVIRFSGTHTGSDQYYEKLLAYMEEKGYRVNGDSVEVTLVDSGIVNEEEQFVTELQIPYKKELTL